MKKFILMGLIALVPLAGLPQENQKSVSKYKTKEGAAYSSNPNIPQQTKPLPSINKKSFKKKSIVNQEVEAWNIYKQKDYPKACTLFLELYKKKSSTSMAEGAYYSCTKAKNTKPLLALRGSPAFDEVWNKNLAQKNFNQERYARALFYKPDLFPQLENTHTSSVTLGFSGRFKSGEDGLDHLNSIMLPSLSFKQGLSDLSQIQFKLSHVMLKTGQADNLSLIGSPANPPGAFTFGPTEKLAHGLLPEISFIHEGPSRIELGSGTTPIGGKIFPLPTGFFKISFWWNKAFVSLRLFAEPTDESLLSYTGLKDPYTDDDWGRVLRFGGVADHNVTLGERWNLSSQILWNYLKGSHVKGNQTFGLREQIGRVWKTSVFENIIVGPFVQYQNYHRDLSHFTFGHGGYFSPKHFVQGGFGALFQSQDVKKTIFEGNVNVGLQHIRKPKTPYFPFNNDGRFYATKNQTGPSVSGNLSAMTLVSSHFTPELGVNFRYGDDYKDIAGGLNLHYFFGKRKNLVRTDMNHP
ncbi:MAG: hypothetical protein A2048_06070 [Deltaproteobacteria bacterium GWA2_45_12]|nr:MAG: hypothetical protein A2048_06070 [Deltaproteobacteria bacterium GWA2_45_12]